MKGDFAATVALVSHGNAYLARLLGANAPDLLQNAQFVFVETLEFSYLPEVARGGAPVSSSVVWFENLRRGGAKRLWLLNLGRASSDTNDVKARFSEGFSNSIIRAAVVDYGYGRYDLWIPRWSFGNENNPPTPGLWKIFLMGMPMDKPFVGSSSDLVMTSARLASALEEIKAFANRVKEDFWEGMFSQALATLSSTKDDEPDTRGLLPSVGYDSLAKRIIAASSQAWVFGGMGSWNDLGFSDKEDIETYERVSEELYETVVDAILTATNSFSAPNAS
jgi:hypothetical protein